MIILLSTPSLLCWFSQEPRNRLFNACFRHLTHKRHPLGGVASSHFAYLRKLADIFRENFAVVIPAPNCLRAALLSVAGMIQKGRSHDNRLDLEPISHVMQQADHRFAVALDVALAERHASSVAANVRSMVGNHHRLAVIQLEMYLLRNAAAGVDFRTGIEPLGAHEHVPRLCEGESFRERLPRRNT